MPDVVFRALRRMGLSEIAEEFKSLDVKRRAAGLSLSEAERYRCLFARRDA